MWEKEVWLRPSVDNKPFDQPNLMYNGNAGLGLDD